MKTNKKQVLLILGIAALATLIRLFSTNNRSIWFDEAFSFFVAGQSLPKLIWATAADNHPPFYYLLLHFWLKLGSNEATLRLLSLVFGGLSIPLIFAIAKSLRSPKAGFWAALILATSPVNVYFSQETRMYTLAIFLNLLAFLFFIKLIKKNNTPALIGFFLSTIFGLYTHYYFLFSWFTFNLLFFLFHGLNRRKLIPWLLTQTLILIIFLPWVIIFINNQHPPNWRYPLLLAIPATFAAFAIGGVGVTTLKTLLIDTNKPHIKIIIILLGSLMGIPFLHGIISHLLKNRNLTKDLKKKLHHPVMMTSIFLLTPITTAAIISLMKPIYSPRSLIIFSPFYYLLIAITISNFKTKTLKLVTFSSLVLLSLILVAFMHFNPLFWGDPIKIVAQKPFVDYQPGDVIAHASIYSYYPFRYYHKDEFDEYLVFDSGLSKRTTKIIGGTPVPVEKLTQRYKRLWFVGITFLSPPQDVKTTVSNLSSKHKLVSSSKHNNIEVYLFDIIQENEQ